MHKKQEAEAHLQSTTEKVLDFSKSYHQWTTQILPEIKETDMTLDDKPDAIKELIYHYLETHLSKNEIHKLYLLFKKFGEAVSDHDFNITNDFPTNPERRCHDQISSCFFAH